MTSNLPPEDQPPAQWYREAADEEALDALPEESLTDPVSVGVMFCNALVDDHVHYRTALSNLVTPESLEAWGDFSEPAAFLKGLPDMGYGSMVNEAVGAPDVVYFKIIGDVPTSYQVIDAQPIEVAAVLTMVWRPEYNQWLIHSIGEYLQPEEVPRTDA